MATGWVKAMQCRSNALEDVCHQTQQQQQQPALAATPKKERGGHLLPLGCGMDASVHHCSPKKSSSSGGGHHSPAFTPKPNKPHRRRPPAKPKPKPKPPTTASAPTTLAPSPARPVGCGPFPTLASLPRDHSSRQVVEMIFSSAWCPPSPFPGHVELLFRVHVHPRAAARFEEYRNLVRRFAGDSDPRCAADGNEVMRFHAAPAWLAPIASSSSTSREKEKEDDERHYQPVFGTSPRPSFPGGGIRTFESSGAAHRSGGGKARGRAAMLLCRVIAGRVRSGSEHHGKAALSGISSASESVSGDKGDLVVFDRRAVLPCFLIIYRL